ncbi:Malonyl-[acyl-carrier protein] O-methyltransferase [Tsuneonella dongtanensis]|uniref:Malonyl-[acyl-carrier protein] O-methyltransferase n=1 Tax=Tsuneonella dongtanensis TaxID=692370 RepID=A0A1B2AFE1_9SPHN|nr:methyltransferase domain-containing protein [Tsuneonella dongtanensis]ANY20808.1 Malonyl-[acyl-carrier protein] O-methyltransferase [Tsuneonella dongtanensis]
MLQQRSGAADWLADALVEDALERIEFMRLEPDRALVLGTGAGELGKMLERKGVRVTVAEPGSLDLEAPYPVGGFGLIASLGALDTVNDLPGALIHQRNALGPGGVMIANLVGAGSLPRLRAALLAADGERPAARLHPAVDARSGAALLQRAGFSRQVADSWTLRLRFGSLDTLVADLRTQGLTSALADVTPPVTKAGLERARTAFLDDADRHGRVVETLEILTLTGWRD